MKKTTYLNVTGAVSLCIMLSGGVIFAETVEKEATTTTSAGTISEFGPKTIVIKTEASPDPVRYMSTKTTTYVDEAGALVSVKAVKSGLPVTVYYVKDGDNMVASKVIVRKKSVLTPAVPAVEQKKITTTTTSAGTISEFGEKTIVIKSETSPEPLRYSYGKTTTYVDETGQPVSVETIKSGLPVTVYYDKDGENLVVTKVIVRKAEVIAPAPVIEEKKTTTTTTTEK